MALTDEQRAMLQLLLEGGQGYYDIGSLLGIAPDEVRTRARASLREIGGTDPDAQVAISDYLLGQADPIGRADAVRHLQNDPDANALAERLVQQLRVLAPKAQLPEIPAARGGRRATPPSAPAPAPAAPGEPASVASAPGPSVPGFASRVAGFFSGLGGGGKRRTQLIIAVVAVLALTLAVVLVTSGGGGDKTADCETLDTSQAQQAGAPVIALEAADTAPEGECSPAGQLTFAAQGKNQLALQLNAVGLQPTAQGEAYILWLFRDEQQSLPIGAQVVAEDGNLSLTAPAPAQLAALIAGGAFSSVRLSLATQADAQRITQAQTTGKSAVIAFAGTTALEGALPQPSAAAQGGAQGGTGQAPQGGAGQQ